MSIGQREYIFRKFTNVVIVKTIMEKEITSYFVFLYRGVFFFSLIIPILQTQCGFLTNGFAFHVTTTFDNTKFS